MTATLTQYDPQFVWSYSASSIAISRIRDGYTAFIRRFAEGASGNVEFVFALASLEAARGKGEKAEGDVCRDLFDQYAKPSIFEHYPHPTNPYAGVSVVYYPDEYEVVTVAQLGEETFQPSTGLLSGQIFLPDHFEFLREWVKQALEAEAKYNETYRFAKYPPSFKVGLMDTTPFLDDQWRKEFKVTENGEYWLFDDSRHVHLCSMYGSFECHYISQYVDVEGLNEAEGAEHRRLKALRDEAESELASVIEDRIDYFGGFTRIVYKFPPLTNREIRELVDGEKTYDEILEECLEYGRGNGGWV